MTRHMFLLSLAGLLLLLIVRRQRSMTSLLCSTLKLVCVPFPSISPSRIRIDDLPSSSEQALEVEVHGDSFLRKLRTLARALELPRTLVTVHTYTAHDSTECIFFSLSLDSCFSF